MTETADHHTEITQRSESLDQGEVLQHYIEFWNAETPELQRSVAGSIFHEPLEYHAPVGVLTGAESLIEFRTQFIDHMGSASLVVRRTPETHHDRARLLWEIQLAGGESFASGTDVIAFTTDGRICSISSFLDRAPEHFPHQHDPED
ncbi:nuclear transport factor 2 family protein [Microlunatus sp. Gsoil 973]|uniref:nuclear transport factor 2 family protein n=1 Tax=Microlunatus sp. Gsoil 973 TaxID=2672569 RepID=UPI001E4767A8|nr:nuclear transport factor 2 family protein [Microlunatus sp. Gsoil 973]